MREAVEDIRFDFLHLGILPILPLVCDGYNSRAVLFSFSVEKVLETGILPEDPLHLSLTDPKSRFRTAPEKEKQRTRFFSNQRKDNTTLQSLKVTKTIPCAICRESEIGMSLC